MTPQDLTDDGLVRKLSTPVRYVLEDGGALDLK